MMPPSALPLHQSLQMEFTHMTNRTHNDGIPATADANMMHILTHGFSDYSRDNRRSDFRTIAGGNIKRVGRIGRTENGWWHRDTVDMSVARERRQAAMRRDEEALLAEEIRDLTDRRSRLNLVMRKVEVVHVRTTDAGIRLVVDRKFCNVECKRARQK
jgi:hypothetical protein